MSTVRIPLAEWAPDLPSFPGGSSARVRNVYPKALIGGGPTSPPSVSYGPMRSPAPIYTPLPDRCLGAVGYIANNEFVKMFAGHRHALYVIDHTDTTWRDISNPSTAYNVLYNWHFTVFNGDVIAADRAVPPQVATLLGSTEFTDLSPTAPHGRFVVTIKNTFVLFGDTYEISDDSSWNDRLHWSSAGNHRDWPTPGTTEAAAKQSGTVRLHGPNGQIMGLAADLASADAVIFQKFGVQRMIYSGPPTTFSLTPVESARGCVAPNSIVVSGGIVYYWGEDGIYAFDGLQSRSIGANRVDRTVYGDLDQGNLLRVVGAADVRNHLILWAYPSVQSIDGMPDRILVYNWAIDRWSLAEVTCETLVRMLTIGYTLDELQSILGYDELREIPYPLSSRVWARGASNVGVFDANHQLAFLDSTPLEAVVDTAEMQAAPGMRQMVTGVRPLFSGSVSPTVTIGRRNRMQDDVSWTAPAAINALGKCPVRASGLYLRERTTIPASDDWSDISGVEVDIVQQGRR